MMTLLRRRCVALCLGGAAIILLVVLLSSGGERDPVAPQAAEPGAMPAPLERPVTASPRPGPLPLAAPVPQTEPRGATHVVAELHWGSGRGEFGKPQPAEHGHAEAPTSLAVDRAGNYLLLDPANGRMVRLGPDGKPLGSLPLPGDEAHDLAVADDGTLLVLDTHGDGTVSFLGPDGEQQASLSLREAGLEARSIRGVEVYGEDVYVETHQGDLVRIADVAGTPSQSPTTPPAHPSRDGEGYFSARITDAESGRLHVYFLDRETEQQRFSRELRVPLQVEGLFLVDTNRAGVGYIGLHGTRPGGDGSYLVQLLCLELGQGAVTGQADLPVRIEEEPILDARALDQGGIAYVLWTAQGPRVERIDCW